VANVPTIGHAQLGAADQLRARGGVRYSRRNHGAGRHAVLRDAVQWLDLCGPKRDRPAGDFGTGCQRFPEDLVTGSCNFAICDQFSLTSLLIRNPLQPRLAGLSSMELAGLEPATSWVRCIARTRCSASPGRESPVFTGDSA